MSDETQTTRDVLSAAYDEQLKAETAAPEPGEATVTAAPPAAEATATTPSPEVRERDEAGRFTRKPEAAPEGAKKAEPGKAAAPGQGEAAGVPPSTPAATPVPEPTKWKPPQSWKPGLREKWGTLAPEFQEEAVRLDREYQKIQQGAAESRKLAERVQQALSPFEGLARAQNMDAVSYAGTVMQDVAALHMGTPDQRAAVVARVIQQFGIDVEKLAAALDGKGAPAAPAQPPVNVQAEVQRVLQAERQQAQARDLQATLDKVKAESEFWDDVGGDQRVVAAAAALVHGDPSLTPEVALREAYGMLAERNPDVSGTLKARKAAEAARAQAPTVQRSRQAAVSIKGSPAEPARGTTGKRTLREELEAAVAAQRT